jgi:hypothetical protein
MKFMKPKIQLSFFLVALAAILFGQGCQMAPVLVLWNKSSSELIIEWPNKNPAAIKSNSTHKLPITPMDISGKEYSFVINRNGQRLGYSIDFASLRKLEELRFHRADFQFEENGKIYLTSLDGQKFDILTNQPSRFPSEPILISEAK